MAHRPAPSTLIRLHLETNGLVEKRDYRLTRRNGRMLLSFSTKATSNLLTAYGSMDRVLNFVTDVEGVELELGETKLTLQMELKTKEMQNGAPHRQS